MNKHHNKLKTKVIYNQYKILIFKEEEKFNKIIKEHNQKQKLDICLTNYL